MIWLIRNILLTLSSQASPAQIAFGALFGLALGFCPINCLVWFALLMMVLLLRVNIGMTVVFLGLGKTLALCTLSWRDQLGDGILRSNSLHDLFTWVYNTPILGISGFYRPAVMGGLAFTVLCSIVVVPGMIYITRIYRRVILPKLEKIWIIKILKGSKIYQLYSSIVG